MWGSGPGGLRALRACSPRPALSSTRAGTLRKTDILMELVKLQRQRAVDAVYGALREGILGHLFKPGERLHVDELSEKLGVSLTPVRNAIQQLATEGLVEIRPRSGTFVANLSVQDVEETFEIRCALECLAAEKSTQLIEPAELDRLRALLVSMSRPIHNGDGRRAHEQDNSEF